MGRPDGPLRGNSTALTGGWVWALDLWDLETGKSIRQFFGHSNPVQCVAFSSDGRRLITGSDSVKVWDLGTRRELVRLTDTEPDLFGPVAITRDHQTIVAVGSDGQVRLWRAPSWEAIAEAESREKGV